MESWSLRSCTVTMKKPSLVFPWWTLRWRKDTIGFGNSTGSWCRATVFKSRPEYTGILRWEIYNFLDLRLIYHFILISQIRNEIKQNFNHPHGQTGMALLPCSIMATILGKSFFLIAYLQWLIISSFTLPNLTPAVWLINFPKTFIASDRLAVFRFFF